MTITEYRREFSAYNSEIELAHYQHRSGLSAEPRTEPILDRYSDLFTKDAIATLKEILNNASSSQETEQRGLRYLIGAAYVGYLERRTKEVTNEITRCESLSKIFWNGETLSVHDVAKILSNEASSSQRRELYARWTDALRSCADLRAARFEEFQSASREIGFSSSYALYKEASGVDYEKLANATNDFLTRTETPYFNALRVVVERDMADVSWSDLRHADFFYFNRSVWLDAAFAANRLKQLYAIAMQEVGIRIEQQQNIKIDDMPRPSKNPRAACFRIKIPDDVRLLFLPIGGILDYRTFFHEAGHAQHFAWISRSMAERNPEFVYSPDYATTEGFAFLFQHLFNDLLWLQDHLPALQREEQAQSVARANSLATLHSVRRHCAKLSYEIELHNAKDFRSERLAQSYSAQQSQATGFKRNGALYLWDVDDGFYCASYLRAWAFEAAFREYLKTRYGRRWWTARKAGEELIDIWNTGSRYSVEELASLLGFDEISFDFLADDLIKAVREE
jgi:hypothetical protein